MSAGHPQHCHDATRARVSRVDSHGRTNTTYDVAGSLRSCTSSNDTPSRDACAAVMALCTRSRSQSRAITETAVAFNLAAPCTNQQTMQCQRTNHAQGARLTTQHAIERTCTISDWSSDAYDLRSADTPCTRAFANSSTSCTALIRFSRDRHHHTKEQGTHL